MDVHAAHKTEAPSRPGRLWLPWLLLGGALLVLLALQSTITASTAAPLARQITDTETPTVTATLTETVTGTATSTSTSSSTATATATSTATITPTLTATPSPSLSPSPSATLPPSATATATLPHTLTATATRTPTPTSTFSLLRLLPVFKNHPTPTRTITPTRTLTVTRTSTGTPATATATGTITPSPTLKISVTPTEAATNQKLTFTIELENKGLAPAENVVMSNPFPQTLDVDTATATPKGTVNKQDHSVGVTIDRLMPGEKVTVSISVKVNSSATKTETLTHSVTVTYNPGNKTITGSVSYKIKASGLPGTGELPFEDPPPRPLDWSLIFLGAILGMVAFFAVWYGVWARTNQPANGARVLRLALGLGLILLLGGAATAGAGLGLLSPQETLAPPVALADTPTPEMLAGYAIAPAFSPTPVKAAAYHNATAVPYPTLPSFPIPSPTNVPTPASNDEPPPDTSPVVRLIIPALGLDAVVAYVPFDGQTWLIEGLRQEVAWLGNTSWPGLGGNTGLAAHVTVRGMGNGPFRYLDQLKPGDEVTLYTEKNIYTYRVREQTVVEEGDLAVLDATQTSQITLVTCTDWNQELKTYLKRLIVSADLVETDPLDRRGGR